MNRLVVACLVLLIPTSSRADRTEPAPVFQLAPRAITEVDVYEGMAELWQLAGMEQSLLVGAGGGWDHGGLATLDVAFRRRTYHSAWDLLPTTIASGTWLRDGHTAVPLSIGWQLPLGLFSAPYAVAGAVSTWTPATSRFDAGFDVGFGYEWRASRAWAVDADFRLVGLWHAAGASPAMDASPWGVRVLVNVRRYFGE